MVNDEQLRQIMPHLKNPWRSECLPHLQAAMQEFQIESPSRAAAFLAQIAHESGEFRFFEEIWGPTKAQRRYEGRHDLGNTQAGDGFRYRGRGAMQLMGVPIITSTVKSCGLISREILTAPASPKLLFGLRDGTGRIMA